jgi:hypothetical protein
VIPKDLDTPDHLTEWFLHDHPKGRSSGFLVVDGGEQRGVGADQRGAL